MNQHHTSLSLWTGDKSDYADLLHMHTHNNHNRVIELSFSRIDMFSLFLFTSVFIVYDNLKSIAIFSSFRTSVLMRKVSDIFFILPS